jgi:hypothetical protein
MIIETVVAAVFFGVCVVGMGRVFGMLDQCVPSSPEPEAKARARRWKYAVAAVVVGAWLCAVCLAFGLHMPKVLCIVVFSGPAAITAPVLAWVLLVY